MDGIFTVERRPAVSPPPVAVNFALAAAHVGMNLYQLFLLPIFLLPLHPAWALTLAPVALLSNPFWSLIHEAIHDLLHPLARINGFVGRLLAVFFGAPFRVLRLSHLLHHKLNRSPIEGTELYDPDKSSRLRAGPGYYFYIFGGLYLFEAVSLLPFLLPRRLLRRIETKYFNRGGLSQSLVKSLMNDESIQEIRQDGVAILFLFGLSAFCYGKYWGWLALSLTARAFLISFLDNVYHYRTPVNDTLYADNLRLPESLAKIFLYFNLHGVHHRSPAIPWIGLPEVFRREAKPFQGGFLAAALRQLGGPVAVPDLPPACDVFVSHGPGC